MSWKTIKLGDLLINFSVRAKDYDVDTSTLDFLGVSNEEGITKSKYAAEDKAEDYKIIEKDCFAYNPYRVNVGSIALLESDYKGLISPAYVIFKTKPNSIIPQLLLKFLKSSEGLRQIKLHARGTVRQALRFEDLCKIEIALPNYEEQIQFFKKITDVEIESAVLSSELIHQLDLVKQLRQAFLREAMQGKLTSKWRAENSNVEPASELLLKIKAEKEKLVKEGKLKKDKPLPAIKENEIPFEIPESWEWCRLGEVANHIFDGPFGSHLKTADYTSEGVQVIRLENLGVMKFIKEKETFVSFEKFDSISQHSVFEGDIIIGSFLADGVKCVVLPKLNYKAIAKADCFTIRINKELISNRFFMYLLSSDLMFSELFSLLRGMTRLRINTTQLKQLSIPFPSKNEQHQIVTKLDELMQYCDDLEKSIKTSQQQNEMLLQQVLREALEPIEIVEL